MLILTISTTQRPKYGLILVPLNSQHVSAGEKESNVHMIDHLLIAPKGEPIPQRPATTDMVARRLVHGALGMKRPTRTREQLQQEKDMLQSVRGK